jgi:hypothetical protein
MYCSSCGVAVPKGLTYCNHCGAKLIRTDGVYDSPEVRPEMLVAAMVGTFIFGLVAITILIGVMKNALDLPVGQVLAFGLALPFLLLLVLEGVFIRLLLRRRRETDETHRPTLAEGQATNELDAAQARVLPEARASVTEHTTRAFDPVYRDRK